MRERLSHAFKGPVCRIYLHLVVSFSDCKHLTLSLSLPKHVGELTMVAKLIKKPNCIKNFKTCFKRLLITVWITDLFMELMMEIAKLSEPSYFLLISVSWVWLGWEIPAKRYQTGTGHMLQDDSGQFDEREHGTEVVWLPGLPPGTVGLCQLIRQQALWLTKLSGASYSHWQTAFSLL